MNSRDRIRHIPALDGWRAIAIGLVLLHHAGTAFYSSSESYWSHAITRHGVMGVPIFFGISGLLITKLLLEEHDRDGGISLRAFYIRRGFRILPPLFAFLAAVVTFGFVTSPTEIASSLLFFRNYLADGTASVFTGHLWSLSVEEHFYLLWPAVLLAALHRRRALLAAAGLAAGFALWRTADMHMHWTEQLAPALAASMRTDYRLESLLWGAAAAVLLHGERTRLLLKKWFTQPLFWLGAALCVICVVVPGIRMQAVWTGILIPSLLLGTVLHPDWMLSRALDWQPVRWVGRISYSLYLWQQIFLLPGWEVSEVSVWQTLPFSLAACSLCAIASYYGLERPFMRIGRELANRSTRREPATASAAVPVESFAGRERTGA